MSALPVTPTEFQRHRKRLVLLTAAAALGFPLLGAAGFAAPRLSIPGIRPVWITAAGLVVGLFLSLRVEKVAQRLVIRLKETYAGGGSPRTLLGDHLRTYLVILAWLLGIGLAGLAVAVAGAGPRSALWFQGVGLLLTLLAWPTEHKVRLLLERAQDLRARHGKERPSGGSAQTSLNND